MTDNAMMILDREGKYLYANDGKGNAHIQRFGEHWKDVTGDKYLLSLNMELQELREALGSIYQAVMTAELNGGMTGQIQRHVYPAIEKAWIALPDHFKADLNAKRGLQLPVKRRR